MKKKIKFINVWNHVESFVRGYAFKQCSRDPEDPISKTMYNMWVATENNRINDLEHAKAYAIRSIHCEVARWWSRSNRRVEVTEQYCIENLVESIPSSAAASADLAGLVEDLNILKCKILDIAGKLSPKHQQVMACKYEGMSQRQTADLCHMGAMTVNRKLKEVEKAVTTDLQT